MSLFSGRRRRRSARIASVFLALPDDQHFGLDVSRRAGVRSGSVYRWLTKALVNGWVDVGWETPEPQGRPRRRWYRLTEVGRVQLTDLVRAGGSDT